jgi:hypothetical protein
MVISGLVPWRVSLNCTHAKLFVSLVSNPMIFRIGSVGQEVNAFRRSGTADLLTFSRLMIVIAPSYSGSTATP